MKETIERLQRLLGKSFVVRFDDEVKCFVFAPADYHVSCNLSKEDLALDDESLVKNTLDPILNNLQGILDQERPFHFNRYQQMMEDMKSFPRAVRK